MHPGYQEILKSKEWADLARKALEQMER